MHTPILEWKATVHRQKKNNSDWYWSVSIIVATVAILSFMFNSVVFGIFIILSGVTLILLSRAKDQESHFSINDSGVVIDDVMYPFVSLHSFWVVMSNNEPKLLIKSQKLVSPLIIIPIEGVRPEDVKKVMQVYIAEEEIAEPFGRKMLDLLGF